MSPRRVELVCGGLAAAIGVMVAALVLAAGGASWYFALLSLGAVGVGIGSHNHSQRGTAGWLLLLRGSSLALAAATILGVFSVGILLLPATLLAIAASLAGSRHRGPADTR